MTEKDKRNLGILYDANYDKELLKEMEQCKELCYEYNLLRPSETDEKRKLLGLLLGKIKGDITIQPPFWCDYGYNIEVGENFYANHNCIMLDGAKITFGDNVFVAPDCGFYTAGHPIDAERRNKGLEYAYPITVGNNVWFGGGVKVMPGVKIGSNVVVGSGSIVTKDIPDNVIAAGNPCRVIREITEKDIEKEYKYFGLLV